MSIRTIATLSTRATQARTITGVAGVLLLGAALSACGGSSTPAATSSAVATTAATSAAPTTAASSAAGGASSGSYTAAEVATHASDASCWTIVDDTVYDVTKWISQHPGGSDKIVGLCGKDGTSMFSGQHGSSDKAKAALASFKVGTLAS